jgi:NCAIR mutase (PurE)-related protein
MRTLLLSALLTITLFGTQTALPAYKKYYISGIEFDTQVYCADFVEVIKAQKKKIDALEQEVARLREMHQKQLQEKLEKEHKEALKKSSKPIENTIRSKSKIIISDKPI